MLKRTEHNDPFKYRNSKLSTLDPQTEKPERFAPYFVLKFHPPKSAKSTKTTAEYEDAIK
jgi:hypothetical protein